MYDDTCELCEGTGLVECSFCSGRGKTGGFLGRFANTCEVCEGTGKEACDFCDGKGKVVIRFPVSTPNRPSASL